jgi:hypothetical protein
VPTPTFKDDFRVVADYLLAEDPDGDPDWRDCANSRARSAVSRAYYAVFLHLKYALIDADDTWRRRPTSFPSVGVHGLLSSALRTVLSESNSLVKSFEQLRLARAPADYEWERSYSIASAEGLRDVADEAIVGINALTRLELRQLVGEIRAIIAVRQTRH